MSILFSIDMIYIYNMYGQKKDFTLNNKKLYNKLKFIKKK